jgi:YVTN family beta-propeller protein
MQIAVDETTNRIYVTNFDGPSDSPTLTKQSLVEIDGKTNQVLREILIDASGGPEFLGVIVGTKINQRTHKLYMPLYYGHGLFEGVLVFDLKKHRLSRIPFPVDIEASTGITINEETNKIYVLPPDDGGSGVVTVIDGETDQIIKIIKDGLPTSAYLFGIATNQETNNIYVADYQLGAMFVIDGHTDSVKASVPLGKFFPFSLDVDTETNAIYVANFDNDTVTMINGHTNQVVGSVPLGTPDSPLGCLSLLPPAGCDNLKFGSGLETIGVNPRTGTLYAVSVFDNNVTVIGSNRQSNDRNNHSEVRKNGIP